MRTIKFRAWDEKYKEMITLSLENLLNFCNSGNVSVPKFESVKWMQFTGLLDKNGKEIYEGDVIEKKQGDEKFRYDVRFNGGAFGIEFPPPSYSFKSLHELFYTFQNKYEVIGNIYENPELLK